MTLGKYIEILEKADPETKVAVGLGNPHSWRGSYEQLAFEPVANTTVGQMLEEAKGALLNTYHGYKGGDFTMDEDTTINVDYYGHWSDGSELWCMFLDLLITGSITGKANSDEE